MSKSLAPVNRRNIVVPPPVPATDGRETALQKLVEDLRPVIGNKTTATLSAAIREYAVSVYGRGYVDGGRQERGGR